MNGNKLLLDTNIFIGLLNGNSAIKNFIDAYLPVCSFITEMELLSYHALSSNQIATIESYLSQIEIEELNHPLKRKAIELRRNYRLKLPDSIIAATAIYHQLPLLSLDTDFEKVEELLLLSFE